MYIDNHKRYFFCGGGAAIGNSFYLLSDGGHNLGIDWGGCNNSNQEPKYDGDLDALFITHGHHDHGGMVPALVRRNSKLTVYCTEPTLDILLHKWNQTLKNNIQDKPFSFDDIKNTVRQTQIVSNQGCVKLKNGISFFPQSSGHILGSSSLLVLLGDYLTFFTSDICFQDRHLIQSAPKLDLKVDLLIRESTYMNSKSEPRSNVVKKFVSSVIEKLSNGLKILIPALSVDRLQDIHAILEEAGIEPYLDCHPAISNIYIKHLGDNVSFLKGTKRLQNIRDREDLLRSKGGFVVIASSGMIDQNTGSAWWAEQLVPDSSSAILIVNYMDPESQGGKLSITKPGEFVVLNGIPVSRNCTIESFNFSAHMSGDDGANLERQLNPGTIIYTHYASLGDVKNYIKSRKDARGRIVAKVGNWEEIK